jgi:hypothetical protein
MAFAALSFPAFVGILGAITKDERAIERRIAHD